jgi:hypothetical protein
VTYELCTLFDVNYLPRGLVLYRSLARVCPSFRLRVFCMDAETARILRGLALPSLTVIGLEELERHDPELLAVKPTRTRVEYLWTSTPAICAYCLETEPDLGEITYLDADLMFHSGPGPIFDELGGDSVLIVPHRYSPRWQVHEETSGVYNVELLTFRRDPRGLEALRWWRERCLEWCYDRVEAGKFGDQRYLDDWPERFAGVHVLEHVGAGLAPWNAEQYRIERSNGGVTVDGLPLVFYHHHSLTLVRGITSLRRLGLGSGTYELTREPLALVWRLDYPMTPPERELVWEPYLRELGGVIGELRGLVPGFDAGFVRAEPRLVAHEVVRRARRSLSRARREARPALDAMRARRTGGWRDSWRAPEVAAQMEALTAKELTAPDAVAPYAAFQEVLETLVRDYALPDPARLLDFGCGVGHYSELVERYFPGRFLYTGCDFAEPMVAAARRRWPGRTFVVNDLFDNALDLASFDLVLAGALLDVLPEWDSGLDVLLGSTTPYVLLHRQRVLEDGAPRVEIVSGYEGQTTYRTSVTRAALLAVASRHGYALAEELEVDGPVRTFVFSRCDS